MSQTIDADYDGTTLLPDAALPLSPNTRVRLTIESLPIPEKKTGSFLKTARSLKLERSERLVNETR